MGALDQPLAGIVAYALLSLWVSKSKIDLEHLTKRNGVLNPSLRNLDLVYLGGDQESIFLRSFPGGSKASHLWAALRNLCRKGSWIKKIMVNFYTGPIYEILKQ